MSSPTEQFLPALLDGDTDAVHALFGGAGELYDPLSGVIVEPTFYFWAAARYLFLYDRKARVEPVRTTRAGSRACVEVVLHLTLDGRAVPLPEPIARPLLGRLFRLGLVRIPPGAIDYIKYPCTIAGDRFVRETGFRPLFGLKESFRSLKR